jgi:hypothetical protein
MQIHRCARRSCIAALPLKGKNSGFRESRCDLKEAATGVFPCIWHEQVSNKQMFLTRRCLWARSGHQEHSMPRTDNRIPEWSSQCSPSATRGRTDHRTSSHLLRRLRSYSSRGSTTNCRLRRCSSCHNPLHFSLPMQGMSSPTRSFRPCGSFCR